jgi:cystathionine beta-lyase
MWIADMEFKAPEQTVAALQARAAHGAFGYTFTPDSYYRAFIGWEKRRHGYEIKKEWLRFATGVVSALYWLVGGFTAPGDAVAVMTPVYYPFHSAVRDNGRRLVCSALVNTDGAYTVDFARLERDLAENAVKMLILCSPHNPVGRVWTEDELDRLLDICLKHRVLVVSDEIHQDLVTGENKHVPSAIVSGGKYAHNVITLNAPSKTFNLAGLLNSHVVIEDDGLRRKYDAETGKIDRRAGNIMGLAAGEAAYAYGEDWLDGLLATVRENDEYLRRRLKAEAPELIVSPLEGTYLAWLDLRAYLRPDEVADFIGKRCRLAVDYGEWFGARCEGFIRLNLATLPEHVRRAADSLSENLKAHGKSAG